MNLELTRWCYGPDATLGRLKAGSLEFATLEEPWQANPQGPGGARRIDGRESCIPDGDYVVSPHAGQMFRDVWRLANPELGVYDWPDQVPSPNWGRSAVLIHSGNTTDDILGCLLVGMTHGRLSDMPAVLQSRAALNLLRQLLGQSESHTLIIRPTAGTA